MLTFQPAELIATKFRALAQRSKGRDLNDLDTAHRVLAIDNGQLGQIAAHYLHHAGVNPNQFRVRLAAHPPNPTSLLTSASTWSIRPLRDRLAPW